MKSVKKKSKTFEEAMAELEEIVVKLEKGELPIDESIEYFQRGVELSRYCSKKLDEVEKRITLLLEEENGDIKEEIFEYEGSIKSEEDAKIVKTSSEANNGV
jgi:exodeoxyribonuclease VII small subunit